MNCYLEHKEAIKNLQSDIEKAEFKNVVPDRFINATSFKKHNQKVDQMVSLAQPVIDLWNKSLNVLGIEGSVATIKKVPFQGDVDSKVGFSRELINITYNNDVLSKIDTFRKSLGIYESKLSYASYIKNSTKSQEARKIQQEDAERAGVDYTDDYLFDNQDEDTDDPFC